jgi:uncharacterized protein (TIGR03084 family)
VPVDLGLLADDLAAEHSELDAILTELSADQWSQPTPAEGWCIADQVAHLAYFDSKARLAIEDPASFSAELAAAAADPDAIVEESVRFARKHSGQEVLEEWRRKRRLLLIEFSTLDPASRIIWYGPAMSAASFVTARLMETWAHGQDIVDALGIARAPTERLRHIAHLGVRARPYSYASHGMAEPGGEIRVELVAPSGEIWAWGPEDADDSITGPALDFCLVVTRRRHPADTDLVARGRLAEEWLPIAQAYAGPPGAGRRPGQFR